MFTQDQKAIICEGMAQALWFTGIYAPEHGKKTPLYETGVYAQKPAMDAFTPESQKIIRYYLEVFLAKTTIEDLEEFPIESIGFDETTLELLGRTLAYCIVGQNAGFFVNLYNPHIVAVNRRMVAAAKSLNPVRAYSTDAKTIHLSYL